MQRVPGSWVSNPMEWLTSTKLRNSWETPRPTSLSKWANLRGSRRCHFGLFRSSSFCTKPGEEKHTDNAADVVRNCLRSYFIFGHPWTRRYVKFSCYKT